MYHYFNSEAEALEAVKEFRERGWQAYYVGGIDHEVRAWGR